MELDAPDPTTPHLPSKLHGAGGVGAQTVTLWWRGWLLATGHPISCHPFAASRVESSGGPHDPWARAASVSDANTLLLEDLGRMTPTATTLSALLHGLVALALITELPRFTEAANQTAIEITIDLSSPPASVAPQPVAVPPPVGAPRKRAARTDRS